MRAKIACIGAGRMGRGIAQCVAHAGHEVTLLDAKSRDGAAFAAFAEGALEDIRGALMGMVAIGAFGAEAVPVILARVSVLPLERAAEALAGAAFVFEGVPEVKEPKAEAFALFDAHADAGAVLASTTSTMLSTELAALTARPEAFLNAHFLNPAFLVPLVEVSPSERTSAEALAALKGFLEAIGKVPVVCKASPGYIVPRIQALAMNEAARLVEEGVASAEDVDRAVKYGFGFRFAVLGLLEFIDWGGGDILYYASRYMSQAMEDPRFEAPAIVKRNMEEGRIGMKTGSGFLDYEGRDLDAYRQARMADFLKMLEGAGMVRPPVLD
ncbi:3-hydroxybutyryl-CoA dehydrogenase [Oceanicella sp. SM1341]|uniref:3-hydroxybutyryl-CoA dehydrogenase n=1 Tax=Oceanicella sp. SM1341 TaxID=1548889 RepID=UPI000E4ABAE9|nr:3-hydroxybutyryl-CoA dehydrogenase [Oceanicella sp. SM1341]